MRAVFDDPQRRVFLLYKWLSALPTGLQTRNPVEIFEYYFQSIALERSDVRVTERTVQFNARIVLQRGIFLAHEVEILQAKPEFDELSRELWMRDFLMVIYKKRHTQWPLYALLAVQRLVFVKRNWLPMLMDAEHILQGLGGRPDGMPCHCSGGGI
jgi:hypothetical protein